MEAFDWNVVVVGYWNPAILTPAGIGRRLFGLKEGTPVLIEVPLDGLAPHRVKHDGLTVTAERGQLTVLADDPKYAGLDRARAIAARAIGGLPETPLTAAGYNVRVRMEEPPSDLLTATKAPMDDLLSDASFTIESRGFYRSLSWKNGLLNLNIQHGNDLRVDLNFHRQSTEQDELLSWLREPIAEVEEVVSRVFDEVVRCPLGEIGK